jgi:TorA maturation chaperone TorD
MLAEGVRPRFDSDEEILRAAQYRLLSRFLAAPPDQALLSVVAGFEGDETPLGRTLGTLGRLARRMTPAEAADEYFNLFIGVGRGELLPYASYYLTGFLHEKPLARLRRDMARLGIVRADHVKEPEDHMAAICEMLAGLIEGAFGEAADLATQQRFFDDHLAPWAERFFADLEAARSAVLYAPVGTAGRLFFEIERTAFGMAE